MSVRSRRSTHIPATPVPQASNPELATQAGGYATIPLPPYEEPSFTLSPEHRDKLATLLRNHPASDLHTKLKEAADDLITHSGEINDMLRDRRSAQKRKRSHRDNEEANETAEQDEAAELAEMERRVEGMTTRMEQNVRRVIDAQASVQAVTASLQEIQANAVSQSQRTATQASRMTTQADEEDDENENPSDRPTPLMTAFEDKLTRRTDAYQADSMRIRYSEHPYYVQFKLIVHDAMHADDAAAAPLEHASKWFGGALGEEPTPGVTTKSGNDEEDDDDDDIAIARETISTKCPLTLKDFEDPVTSKKCPHSFERNAILEMIKAQRPPTRGARQAVAAGWVQAVQCPVAGCQSRLAETDLHVDAVLVRRIRRIQKAREIAREREEEDEEHDGLDRQEIDSDSADDVDEVNTRGSRRSRPPTQIKAEGAKRRLQTEDIDDDDN